MKVKLHVLPCEATELRSFGVNRGASTISAAKQATAKQLIELGFNQLLPADTLVTDKKFEVICTAKVAHADRFELTYCTICYTNPNWSLRTQGVPTVINRLLVWTLD